ncbi:hypothetical protein RF11_01946 [Thelohanellus kitauei]|uniref:Uncharacterized protein n=1 Tax=Thelohanellus kitauei TaxID=669202 RepID=A0A0C2ML46_THEKT|nr:hypothetical protein RF11_01946 [Thelohanellus kitauei]
MNIMLRAFVFNEFHLSNVNFMHFSDQNRGLMFESNSIPLVADFEVTTRCDTRFYVLAFLKLKSGKIKETYYNLNLVDRRSFVIPKLVKYGLSPKKRFNPQRLYICRRNGVVETKTLPQFI